MAAERPFTLDLVLRQGYEADVRFGNGAAPSLTIDEPPPLGAGHGPDPSSVLGAAVAGCLTSSLAFCLRKARVDLRGVTVHVTGFHTRNEQGRLRVGKLEVIITPTVAAQDRDRVGRCEALFEDFCVVTEAVRHGIEVDVSIQPRTADPSPPGPGPSR
jgi:uncharacterized OsmC-like protein